MTRSEALSLFRSAIADVSTEAPAEAKYLDLVMFGESPSIQHTLTTTEEKKLKDIIDGRLRRIPLQYLLQTAYFYGSPFYVDSRVLIPRIETELIVQRVIDWFCDQANGSLGTESPGRTSESLQARRDDNKEGRAIGSEVAQARGDDNKSSVIQDKPFVIPAKAGIQGSDFWIPGRARDDNKKVLDDNKKVLDDNKKILNDNNQRLKILDIGTGSGVLGITLALEIPSALVLLTDISGDALAVASKNVDNYKLSIRASLVQSDLLMNVTGQFNVIVANLPYIPADRLKTLDPEVKDHEPIQALDGGLDGFDCYRKLFPALKKHLLEPWIFISEIDYSQTELAIKYAQKYFPNAMSEILKDLEGRERFLIIMSIYRV